MALALEAASTPQQVPSWCMFVPEQHRESACRGSSGGCSCKAFCKEQVPSFSWQYNPECCSCAAASSVELQSGTEAFVALASARPRQVPSWCRNVPPQERKDACRGSHHGCSCQGFCAQIPSFTFHWNP